MLQSAPSVLLAGCRRNKAVIQGAEGCVQQVTRDAAGRTTKTASSIGSGDGVRQHMPRRAEQQLQAMTDSSGRVKEVYGGRPVSGSRGLFVVAVVIGALEVIGGQAEAVGSGHSQEEAPLG